jgi:hypothetical protein
MTGGGRRAAFVTSINLAQISEFSLVIATLGVTYHHIQTSTVAITIYAMAIMAVVSSYAIRYSHPLYQLFDRLTGNRDPRAAGQAEAATSHAHDIVLLGYHRCARALVEAIELRHPELLQRLFVIDFNPVALKEAKSRGVAGLFGDIASIEVLKHAHITHARFILSTIPDLLLKGVDNMQLVRMCTSIAPRAEIIATADDALHDQRLRAEGAAATVKIYEIAAEPLLTAITQSTPATPHPQHAEVA